MTDTARTLAAVKALLADNTAGAISPQDVRDAIESIVNPIAGGGFDTDIRKDEPNVFETLDITTDTMTFRAPDDGNWDILIENKVGGLNEIWIHDQGPSRVSLTSDGGTVEMHSDHQATSARHQVLVDSSQALLKAIAAGGALVRGEVRVPDVSGDWDIGLYARSGVGILIKDTGPAVSDGIFISSSAGRVVLEANNTEGVHIQSGAANIDVLDGKLGFFSATPAAKAHRHRLSWWQRRPRLTAHRPGSPRSRHGLVFVNGQDRFIALAALVADQVLIIERLRLRVAELEAALTEPGVESQAP